MKRSLAEELADLASTTPAEVDLERDELGGGAALLDSEDDTDALPTKKRAKKAPEKGMRMRAGIDLESREYAGTRVSKAEAFDQSDTDDDDDNNDDGSEENDKSEGSDFSEEGESDDESHSAPEEIENSMSPAKKRKVVNGSREANGHVAMSDEGSESEMSDSDLGSDASDSQDIAQKGQGSRGTHALENVYAEVQAADEQALELMKSRLAKERAKAAAVRNQHAVWDRLLEARILLQKGLTAAQQMPDSDRAAEVQSLSAPVADAYSQLGVEAVAVLETLMKLQSALASQNPELESKSAWQEREVADGSSENIWTSISHQYDGLKSYRDTSLDKWYKKTLLASGSAALKGNLRILNQSISSQVTNMMQGSERLIRRACLPVSSAPRKLCQSPQGAETLAQNPEAVDEEVYDDAEFYQQLLKEFLEASGAAGQLGPQAANRGKKSRGMRDRRASKGRRLRYDVQEKLVNFMVAAKYEEPAMAPQLFRNLFGQRTD